MVFDFGTYGRFRGEVPEEGRDLRPGEPVGASIPDVQPVEPVEVGLECVAEIPDY